MNCPCCGSPMSEENQIGTTVMLSRLERRLFDRLSSSFGQWVGSEALIHAAYWDSAAGGPDAAPKAISSTLRGLRRKLGGVGLMIDWNAGRANGERRLRRQHNVVKEALTVGERDSTPANLARHQ